MSQPDRGGRRNQRNGAGEAVEDGRLEPQSVLVTQMETDSAETAALIRIARRRGARTVHTIARAMKLAGDALRMVDVLVVNEDEAAWRAADEGGLPAMPMRCMLRSA